ncbi:hypothetical protein EDD70_0430 [Hydrogenoanaerobacterium saccharovorans]|uniref:Uncharacterized protein n=1 Tax=Hydrogenoanaerobacterium saccharovorans TaxID=474960 RepID=A0A1H8B1H6_9FIRM|nr:hypothetical protein [Hydrogenoanaerobacterium saccharovorans]RPF47637.1 hypothetical protein EDD70_0430 [Hydrogenoanaerobacterium saccharovorans]SEM76760.1 hypothetical protein SAMN05216180_1663 [Hydrogenoanaerobacterium saccharovorans]
MNYTAMIDDYTHTETMLRERVAALRQQMKLLPLAERDEVKRRLNVMQEEMYDVALVRLELIRRQREEEEMFC